MSYQETIPHPGVLLIFDYDYDFWAMHTNESLIWFIISLATLFILALLSRPAKPRSKLFLILFAGNVVLHFCNIYLTEFSALNIDANLNPFFAANYGPLLLLYFRHFRNGSYKGLRHFVPYFLVPSVMLLFSLTLHFRFNVQITLSLIVVTYNIACIMIMTNHYRKVQSELSKSELRWLLTLLVMFSLWMFVSLLHILLSIFVVEEWHNYATQTIFILGIFLIAALVYFAIVSPEIFRSQKIKYSSSNLEPSSSLHLAHKIQEYLETDAHYTKTDITIEQISIALHTSPKHVSQVINQHLGANFYELINNYRIAKAKDMLATAGEEIPIKHIMYDCGFSNKTTFNKAFKDRVQMTPSKYKASLREKTR